MVRFLDFCLVTGYISSLFKQSVINPSTYCIFSCEFLTREKVKSIVFLLLSFTAWPLV